MGHNGWHHDDTLIHWSRAVESISADLRALGFPNIPPYSPSPNQIHHERLFCSDVSLVGYEQ
jgi:hypothetical protein